MSDFQRLNDSDLIRAFLTGDGDAFAEIYDRYSDRLFTAFLAAGEDRTGAAERTRDTFLEAAERLRQSEHPDDLGIWLAGLGGVGSVSAGGLAEGEVMAAPLAVRARVLTKVDAMVAVPDTPVTKMRELDIPPEWMKIGLFAAVTLVVALIGFAVAAQFEPLQLPPTTAGSDPSPTPTIAPTSTTTTIGVTSTTVVTGTTSTTGSSVPGSIEVSTDTIDFGGDGTAGEFELTNPGGAATDWTLASSSGALAVSAGSGEIPGGESVTIEISLNRDEVGEGEISETLTVSWPDGQIQIAVVGIHEDNPVIHNPQASPGSVEVEGCDVTRTTVSARVRDTSPLESVVVRWSPNGSEQRESEMEAVGNDIFEAAIGPFTATGTAEVRIVAFDELGNAGGATIPITVTGCD